MARLSGIERPGKYRDGRPAKGGHQFQYPPTQRSLNFSNTTFQKVLWVKFYSSSCANLLYVMPKLNLSNVMLFSRHLYVCVVQRSRRPRVQWSQWCTDHPESNFRMKTQMPFGTNWLISSRKTRLWKPTSTLSRVMIRPFLTHLGSMVAFPVRHFETAGVVIVPTELKCQTVVVQDLWKYVLSNWWTV